MPHDVFKKVLSVEMLRAHEIRGPELILADSISGKYISGQSVVGETGNFEELWVDGVRHIPKNNLIYAFRFGGSVTSVPNRLPKIDGHSYFTGLLAGKKFVFVENTGAFHAGDHIIINPGGISGSFYTNGNNQRQEECVVDYTNNYVATDCRNISLTSNAVAGSNTIKYDSSEYEIKVNDKIFIMTLYDFFTVIGVDINSQNSSLSTLTLNRVLEENVPYGTPICLGTPYLAVTSNLQHSYTTGTIVANKFGNSSSTGAGSCLSNCYDAQHLYLEIGTGNQYYNGDMTWYATGYRDYFIGYSGIESHITGLDITGLLTLIYPKE